VSSDTALCSREVSPEGPFPKSPGKLKNAGLSNVRTAFFCLGLYDIPGVSLKYVFATIIRLY